MSSIKKNRRMNKIFNAHSFDELMEVCEKIKKEVFSNGGLVGEYNFVTTNAEIPDFSRIFSNNKNCINKLFGNKKECVVENQERVIFEYIKRGNKIVGILVGWNIPEMKVVGVGYSLCNPKDKFSWKTAVAAAWAKMFHSVMDYSRNVPHSIKKQEHEFQKRCTKYFKNMDVSVLSRSEYTNINRYRASLPMCLITKIQKEHQAEIRKARKAEEIKEIRESINKKQNGCETESATCYFKEMEITHDGNVCFRERSREKPNSDHIEVTYKINIK